MNDKKDMLHIDHFAQPVLLSGLLLKIKDYIVTSTLEQNIFIDFKRLPIKCTSQPIFQVFSSYFPSILKNYFSCFMSGLKICRIIYYKTRNKL